MTTHALPLPLTPPPPASGPGPADSGPGVRVTVWLTHGRWERCECQSWASPGKIPTHSGSSWGASGLCQAPLCPPLLHTPEPGPGPIQSSPVLWQLPALPLPIPCWGPGLFPVQLRPVISGCRSQEAVGPRVEGAQRACWGASFKAGDFPVQSPDPRRPSGLQPASPVQTASLEPRAQGSFPRVGRWEHRRDLESKRLASWRRGPWCPG